MKEQINKVLGWQKIFGRVGHTPAQEPTPRDLNLAYRRASFMYEELSEYLTAVATGDTVGVLDALADLQYFLYGMVVIHGMQDVFEEAFNIVHESNMSKLGADGQPAYREDGKALKGPNYWSPREKLEELLK